MRYLGYEQSVSKILLCLVYRNVLIAIGDCVARHTHDVDTNFLELLGTAHCNCVTFIGKRHQDLKNP